MNGIMYVNINIHTNANRITCNYINTVLMYSDAVITRNIDMNVDYKYE